MRPLLLISILTALALSCRAADQVINVTPQNLNGWTVTGADKSALGSGTQLVLPAGVQLSRKFSGSAVILHLLVRPVFSTQPADWPIVGLGGAALTLIQKNDQGHLVLVVDEMTAIDLPWTISLDPKGSQDPVELFLACDPGSGVGLVGFQDQRQAFDVKSSTKSAEVWLSAGVPSAWPVDVMQVLLFDPNADGVGDSAKLGADSTKHSMADKLQAALDRLRALSNANGAASGAGAGGGTAAKAGSVSRLEVFTPPSVRRTQVITAVRSSVAKAQAK